MSPTDERITATEILDRRGVGSGLTQGEAAASEALPVGGPQCLGGGPTTEEEPQGQDRVRITTPEMQLERSLPASRFAEPAPCPTDVETPLPSPEYHISHADNGFILKVIEPHSIMGTRVTVLVYERYYGLINAVEKMIKENE